MISVHEAKGLIINNVSLLASEVVNIIEAEGRVLAKDIISSVNLPGFDQAAMDGYAYVLPERFETEVSFEIIGEVPAGAIFNGFIKKGQCVRIFTGAKVPENTYGVVVQEEASVTSDGKMRMLVSSIIEGSNIRKEGSQIHKGSLALGKGEVMSAGLIGFVASMGFEFVEVSLRPKVGIIITGDELQAPGTQLSEAGLFESNSFMLYAALKKMGIQDVEIARLKDDKDQILNSFKLFLEDKNIVLLSGGISVGKYDLVKWALKEIGVSEIFYKIKQKPGKPLYFGKYNNTLVFALPGNPAASLTCFYEYVSSAIFAIQGFGKPNFLKILLPVAAPFKKKIGIANFLKGKIINNKVVIKEGQESFILRSFSDADCFVFLDEHVEYIEENDIVEVHLLPNY